MQRAFDFLAEELKEQRSGQTTPKDATKARKAGKKERIAAMVKKLVKKQPAPVVDLLAVLGR